MTSPYPNLKLNPVLILFFIILFAFQVMWYLTQIFSFQAFQQQRQLKVNVLVQCIMGA